MPTYYIKVLGEIIATDDIPQYAQGWACGSIGGSPSSPTFAYNRDEHVVLGDLLLSETTRSVPYAFYYTEKGIRGNHITCLPGEGPAFSYLYESLSSLEQRLLLPVDTIDAETYYNALFVEAFSTLELYLSDLLLCCIFGNEKVYLDAVSFFRHKKKACIIPKDQDALINTIHNYFFNFVYHRFDKVAQVFKGIIDVDFPSYDGLSELLRKRNNIVHRCSLDGFSRMVKTTVTKESVGELLKLVSQFAYSLQKSVSDKMTLKTNKE